MATFDYLALNENGRKCRGVIEADSLRGARSLLRDQSLIPVEVYTNQEAQDRSLPTFFKNSISHKDLSLITRQLATLLQAGIPLENCLKAVAEQSEKRHVNRIILAARSKVREGFSFSESLAEHPSTFNKIYRATIAAGERTGHLDLVLEKLANHIETQQKFRQKVQLALVYPIILVVMSVLLVTGLMLYVVPEILNTITESGQPLPIPTQILVFISTHLGSYWFLYLTVVITSLMLFKLVIQKPDIQFKWDRLLLNLWGLRDYSRGVNVTRYTSTLAILTNSGLALNDSMAISSAVSSNTCFQQATNQAQQLIQEGVSLNKALEKTGYFPPMVIQLIASGEQSGKLPEMLFRAATTHEDDLQQRVATLVSLFEPIILLLMGGLVLAIVLAVLLPILNFNQLVVG